MYTNLAEDSAFFGISNKKKISKLVFAYRNSTLAQLISYMGPALIASIAYMDPGNYGTDIQGGAAYGFGWYVENYRGRRAVWHYGSTVGFRTAIVRFPDERSAVVVLLNRDGTDAHALALKLADLFLFDAK